MAGLSLDYYWKWIGVGGDVDYIRNSPKNTYPTQDLVTPALTPVTDFTLTEEKVTRFFYGLGPDARYLSKNNKFSAELNLRGGLASIKGGMTSLSAPGVGVLNYHAGYDDSFVLTAKGQIRLNYFINNWLGFHLGAYYMYHFDAKEKTVNGVSASYWSYNDDKGVHIISTVSNIRSEPCNCGISSIGVFGGVTFRIRAHAQTRVTYSLTVTARDKFTREVLPNTDVAVKNIKGEIIRSQRTNSFGVVTFDNMVPENYTIEGLLYNVALENGSAQKNEFVPNKTLQKEILYGDRNFIIKGKTFICNSTNPLPDVTVVLENPEKAFRKSTITDAQGQFILQLPEIGTYTLFGKKQNYFSQVENINATNYDREKNLFVKLEMCSQEAECDKAIRLKNILYDLDKYFIRDDAKPELNKLVRFMLDNPEVIVELGSHTDSRGSNEYNMTLSQNRANAAVDYIVSKGIERSRLIAKGYGETQLLNRCADGVDCTEAEHQVNRRTEFKLICHK